MAWTRLFAWSPDCQTLQGLTKREATTDPTFVTGQSGTNTYVVQSVATVAPVGRAIATQTEVRTGFWFKHAAGATGSNRPFIAVIQVTGGNEYFICWDAATAALTIRVTTTGQIATVSLPAALQATNTWMHIGIYFKANASTGVISVYINGVQALTYSGNTGSGVIAVSTCGRNSSTLTWAGNVWFDDWYIDGGSGNADAAPSPSKFLFSSITGAGTDTAWTPNTGANYQAVDDPTFDTDSTYVAAPSSGLRDNYECSDITLPSGYTISKVIVVAYAKKTSSADCKLTLETLLSGTYGSATAQALSTGYEYYFAEFALDPSSTLWSQSSFNSTKIGIKSAGTYT